MPTPNSNEEWEEFWDIERARVEAEPAQWFRSWVKFFPTWKGRETLRLLNRSMFLIMARGKGNAQATPNNSSFDRSKFLDINLVEADWPEIIRTYGNPDILVDAVSDLLEAGYRVGLSHNPQNDAFICSVTCRDTESPNNGYTFNSFAETWFEALQAGMYKHYVKTGKNWLSSEAKKTRPKFG